MRVCYFGTYRAGYSRNQILQEGLRRAGVDLVTCHVPLWTGIEDRIQVASGGWARPAFLRRLLSAYRQLLAAHAQVGDYDVMVLGYPGQLDAPLARWLTRRRAKPLVLDVFMSVYLIAKERELVDNHRASGRMIRWLEGLACRLPDRLLSDTPEYVAWFGTTYGLPPDRFRLVPTGADDRVFRPVSPPPRTHDGFRVLYYGTFIRNHGVDQIVRAAALLKNEPGIEFEMVGDGPERVGAETLACELGASNITFVDWIEKSELPYRAAAADLCLGAFGTTPQSLMTIHNKIYEGLAMAKPVLTGISPAICQSLTHGQHVYLCERANPHALADAVRTLREDIDLRQRLSLQGHQLFQEQFDLQHSGARLAAHLSELLTGSGQSKDETLRN